MLKASRTHLFDMLLRSLVVYAPLVVLGVPLEVLAWYPAAVTILGPVGHSNLDLCLPSWIHPFLLTPQGHRIHHARALALSSSNYAGVVPLWDVLFGTFEHPDHHPVPDVGIEPDPLPRDFLGQLALPLRWRRLTGSG